MDKSAEVPFVDSTRARSLDTPGWYSPEHVHNIIDDA